MANFTWNEKAIILYDEDKNFMAYNFEERNLTYIGKVADNLFESINRYECIEYKDAVYFVAVNGVDFSNTQIKVRKLYRINDQEEIIFNLSLIHI